MSPHSHFCVSCLIPNSAYPQHTPVTPAPFSFLCLILLCLYVSWHFVSVSPHTLCFLTETLSCVSSHFLVSPHTFFLTLCVSSHFPVSPHTMILCLLILGVSSHFPVSPHTFFLTLRVFSHFPVSPHTFISVSHYFAFQSFLCHTISHFSDFCVTARQKEREQETSSVCLYFVYVWMCLCMCECVYVCVSVSVYVWMCLCMREYVCVCVSVSVLGSVTKSHFFVSSMFGWVSLTAMMSFFDLYVSFRRF